MTYGSIDRWDWVMMMHRHCTGESNHRQSRNERHRKPFKLACHRIMMMMSTIIITCTRTIPLIAHIDRQSAEIRFDFLFNHSVPILLRIPFQLHTKSGQRQDQSNRRSAFDLPHNQQMMIKCPFRGSTYGQMCNRKIIINMNSSSTQSSVSSCPQQTICMLCNDSSVLNGEKIFV